MRSRRSMILAPLLALLASASPPPASAQSGGPYSIPWGNLAGGGTIAAGGAYRLAGAVGQPDASQLAGGGYLLMGGFVTPAAANPVATPTDQVPRVFAFRLPVPNPASGAVMFTVELPRPARVTLALYSVDGRLVRTLSDARREAGFHRIAWDGRTDAGTRVAPGVYFARASCDGISTARRFVLID